MAACGRVERQPGAARDGGGAGGLGERPRPAGESGVERVGVYGGALGGVWWWSREENLIAEDVGSYHGGV